MPQGHGCFLVRQRVRMPRRRDEDRSLEVLVQVRSADAAPGHVDGDRTGAQNGFGDLFDRMSFWAWKRAAFTAWPFVDIGHGVSRSRPGPPRQRLHSRRKTRSLPTLSLVARVGQTSATGKSSKRQDKPNGSRLRESWRCTAQEFRTGIRAMEECGTRIPCGVPRQRLANVEIGTPPESSEKRVPAGWRRGSAQNRFGPYSMGRPVKHTIDL